MLSFLHSIVLTTLVGTLYLQVGGLQKNRSCLLLEKLLWARYCYYLRLIGTPGFYDTRRIICFHWIEL